MKRFLSCSLLLIVAAVVCHAHPCFQGGGRADPPKEEAPKGGDAKAGGSAPGNDPKKAAPAPAPAPRKPPPATTPAPARVPKEAPPPPAQRPRTSPTVVLTINVNPPDSTVVVKGEGKEYSASNNSELPLKPGAYTVIARKARYGQAQQPINLYAGHNDTVTLNLVPLPGSLSVTPNITGAEIEVSSMGSYTGSVKNLEVAPGSYTITVTKKGYKTETREVVIEPDGSESVPITMETEKKKPPVRTDAAMKLSAQKDGKYLVVSLSGVNSQITATSGSIAVTLGGSENPASGQSVTGLLTGLPCRIDFVPLDNVGEYSFKETPGINNQWGRIIVRVTPKQANRAIRFSINWQVIGRSPAR